MRFPSLEELAERWTFAHTITVVAWSVVIVLGLVLLFRPTGGSSYPSTQSMKVYAGENATFTYPQNWTINSACASDRHFIELPGNIRSDYKGEKGYELTIYGTSVFDCIKGRPERFDIYPEEIVASDKPCAQATSTRGEKLSNGLYLQLREAEGGVTAVYIKQNSCFAPADTAVLGFGFSDPEERPGDVAEFGSPRVNKDDFLASPQYQDIKTLAESIRY